MRWVHHHTIGSTNDAAAAEAAQWTRDHAEPVVVSADIQTLGRGRRGRAWASPPGGAYFSLAWPAADEPRGPNIAPLLAGLALREAVADSAGITPDRLQLKWPNDVLCDGRKLAGVLCESTFNGGAASAVRALVIGVGINVATPAQALGPCRLPATSILEAGGTHADPAEIARRCVDALAARLAHGTARLTPDDHTTLNAALAFRGQPVAFDPANQRRQGDVIDVDPLGKLRLRTHDGTIQPLDSGEVDALAPLAPLNAPTSKPPQTLAPANPEATP
ncbi:MAG: biotin--[acetyl-CoA-carboxylase] ligase [Planctomycetota bacterium]